MKKSTILIGFLLILFSCKEIKNFQYQAECLGIGQEGTQRIQVTSVGKSAKDCKERSRKDAVHALIFRGIQIGIDGCVKRPIIVMNKENEEKHKVFFEKFFSDNGEYSTFIVGMPEIVSPPGLIKTKMGEYKCTFSLSVRYDALVQYLEANGIIKSLRKGL